MDRVNDYHCTCETEDRLVNDKTQAFNIWGGKNCSVELEGCRDKNACQNGGICHAYLSDDNIHKANCTCPEGNFSKKICSLGKNLNENSHNLILYHLPINQIEIFLKI